jgi:ribosomal protein L7Ae-like RNA K-turn-binding protein
VRLIKHEFPEIKQTLDTEIPKKVLKSRTKVIAKFLKGFFDAEGYVDKGQNVGIASTNKILIKQIQLLLLRFSVITSFHVYDNRRNPYSKKPIYKLQINDKQSLINFERFIAFTSSEKKQNLRELINKKTDKSFTRQIVVPGKEVRKIIEKAGYNLQLFPKVTNFFINKRMMSKQTFKNSILACIKDKRLYKKLEEIYNYPILPVKINKIQKINKKIEMIDISVKNQNFIANGIIVHNSAKRYAKNTELAAKAHYKKVAEYVKNQFLGNKNLKGIIVGGPGPTKYDFVEGGFITTELRKKIIAIKDLGYTGEFGLQELVDKSQDVLVKEDIMQEKKIMGKFFDLLAKKPGMASYGEKEVMQNLKNGVVDILLLSEDLDDKKIEDFEKEAKAMGTTVNIISTETREGVQLKEIGKVAGILRYEVQ